MQKQLAWTTAAMVMAMGALGCGNATPEGADRSGTGGNVPSPTADAGPAPADDDTTREDPTTGEDTSDAGDSRSSEDGPGAGTGTATDGGASSDGDDGDGAPSTVEDPITGDLGSACDNDGDCDGELTCARESGGTRFPRGYCSRDCNFEEASCGPGGSCAWIGERSVLCAAQCDTDDECRPDYSCQRPDGFFDMTGTFCLPAPEGAPSGDGGGDGDGDGDRDEGGEDFPWGGDDEGEEGGGDEGSRALADVGSACSRDVDCDGNLCLEGLPGGYCSAPCDPDGDPTQCGDGAGCVRGGERSGFCARTCTDSAQCRPDYTCDTWSTWWGSGDDDGTTYCTVSADD